MNPLILVFIETSDRKNIKPSIVIHLATVLRLQHLSLMEILFSPCI